MTTNKKPNIRVAKTSNPGEDSFFAIFDREEPDYNISIIRIAGKHTPSEVQKVIDKAEYVDYTFDELAEALENAYPGQFSTINFKPVYF